MKITYANKLDFDSSHFFAVAQVSAGSRVADFGSGEGYVTLYLLQKGCEVDCYDRQNILPENERLHMHKVDLDQLNEIQINPRADYILLLDILEHLIDPSQFLQKLRSVFIGQNPTVIITMPNVAFISVRLGLLLGKFNYTSRGTMDRTHLHFYTRFSFCRLLREQGYVIDKLCGIPAPFPLVLRNKWSARIMLCFNRILIAFFPGLFSYQTGCVARIKPK